MTARRRAAPASRAARLSNRPPIVERAREASRTLESALEESEAMRDDLRRALRALKARHEALELVHAGCEGRRAIVVDEEAAREVRAARTTASAERERRMRAEARAEAAEAALARAEAERGARERAASAALASGRGWDGLGAGESARAVDARSEEAKALAAATRELESLRRTCDRQKRELAQARERLKTLEGAVRDGGLAIAATAGTTDASESQPTNRRPGRAATKSVAAAAPREPSSAPRADVAESCPPPMPSIDEAWTARPPARLPPLGGAPALSRPAPAREAASAAPKSRPKPPRSRVIGKIAKQVAKTSRAFRLPT